MLRVQISRTINVDGNLRKIKEMTIIYMKTRDFSMEPFGIAKIIKYCISYITISTK